ncbi:PAS domain-containing sensor histidine kinase [Temperatibacter marinus]|uniref:histidine kinase n=1 Tax=Temperatibacter marinus TaxID=1456591 RepID=A0AA52ECZ8_9PROT|nr:PAS domain-containing sensor histidine kinase [Temperatibacter marinus]WND02491.1 PAS domain-containing sensor histidine kinase [Temperatibacter marinus]
MSDINKAKGQLLRFAELQNQAGLSDQQEQDSAFGASIRKAAVHAVPANTQVSGFLDHLIVDNSLPVYVTSVDGMLLHVNEKFQELADVMGDVSLSPGPLQIMNKMPAPTMQPIIQDVLASQSTVKAEETLTIRGKQFVFQGRHMPVCNARGDIIAIAGTYEDITNLTKAVEDSKNIHARYQDFARAGSDWMWELSEEMKVKTLSNRFTAVVGQPAMMFIGSKLEQFGEFKANMEGSDEGLEAIAMKKPFRDQLFIIKDYNGLEQCFHMSGVPVFDRQSGEFQGYRGVGKDVTERYEQAEKVKLEKQRLEDTLADLTRNNIALDVTTKAAKDALKTKNDFLATMSHELKTPLNAIIGFAESFIGQKFGTLNDEYRSYAEDIHSAGVHLQSLITDIMDVTLLESGALSLSTTAVSVHSVVSRASNFVAGQAREKSIEFEIQGIDPDLHILADEKRVLQIMINLLNNAVKFTGDGGRIGINVDPAACEHLAITVWDSGIGISVHDQERIFDKFQQVTDDLYARRQNGIGMGLHICRGLAEAMSGKIKLSSEEGKGSRFTVLLPLASDYDDDDIDFI